MSLLMTGRGRSSYASPADDYFKRQAHTYDKDNKIKCDVTFRSRYDCMPRHEFLPSRPEAPPTAIPEETNEQKEAQYANRPTDGTLMIVFSKPEFTKWLIKIVAIKKWEKYIFRLILSSASLVAENSRIFSNSHIVYFCVCVKYTSCLSIIFLLNN